MKSILRSFFHFLGNETTYDIVEFSKESFDDGADNLVLALAEFFGIRQFYGDEQEENEEEEEEMDSQQAFTTNAAPSSKLAPQFKFYAAKGVTLTMWWIFGLVERYR